MKITKIEIENINSLKGYWCIDLTHPDYKKNHDLFVICGETGAGKTTLLDAITLALYGQTPRINSFSNQNELMTRHTANCMARVTYECKNGKFVSEFEQHRSKNRIEGNLQSPSAQITNLETGKVESNLSITALQIRTSEIIQLDYSQFCRSILLAQGKFDDFIVGTPKQKAEILAKLNGTEKYKDFANQLWVKAAKKIGKYKMEKENLDRIEVLSDEEVAQNKEKIKKNQKQVDKNLKQLDEVGQILNWLEKLEELKIKKENAQTERKNYETAASEFSAKEEILENAQKAKNCNSAYVVFNQLRSEQNKEKSELEEKKLELKKAEDGFVIAEKQALKAKTDFDEKVKLQAENEKIWRLVSELDAKLQVEEKTYTTAKKRCEDSANELEQKKQVYKNLVENSKKLEESIKELEKYLLENKNDEKLSEVVFIVDQQNKVFLENQKEIISNQCKLDVENKKIAELNGEIKKLQQEIQTQNENLKDFVSKEYVSISLLLRKSLMDGKACPVCGSVEHPSCKESKLKEEQSSNTIALDVVDISKKIEKLENEKNSAEQRLKLAEKDAERIGDENLLLKEKNKKLIAEINESIKLWNVYVTEEGYEQDFNKIRDELSKKAREFKSKNEEAIQQNLDFKKNQAAIDQIDIGELEEKSESETKNFEEEEKLYLQMKQQRTDLFGEDDVEKVRVEFENEVKNLKEDYEKAEEHKNKCKESKSVSKNSVKTLGERIVQREPEIQKAEKAFIQVLKQNEFESEESFIKYLLTDEELAKLVEIKEKLKGEDSKTKTQLESVKNEEEECLKLNKTQKTKDRVLQDKEELVGQNTALNQEIGNINNILAENLQKQNEYKAKRIEVDKLEEEKVTWERIQEILGTKDGGDFEVFVEALAFKQLLIKANAYVYAISGKYTLVQKEGQVDFLVHDDNYPDSKEDRPVVNMSGGEKFIISLSLALGIAELASQNVQVDSLFLDEGFGTLSGEPLVEAINALKSLQSSGRMLGIITHIDGVIREFDQKIVAKKKSGGVSELIGSGITSR